MAIPYLISTLFIHPLKKRAHRFALSIIAVGITIVGLAYEDVPIARFRTQMCEADYIYTGEYHVSHSTY